ncbi:MAG: PKD domain protein, partial [Polaribacter sp.]
MKNTKKIYKILIALLVFVACTDELRDLSFAEIDPPSNISAAYHITQDNTGVVTITPTAEGATYFDVYFGDATTEPANVEQGGNIQHTYAEGTYSVKVIGYNIQGDAAEITQELIVSFRAPENLMVTIENDASVSKQVNITATADFASMFEFHSGETGVAQPVVTANIGETVSYQYQNAGMYSVKVVAKGGAIATTEHTEDFEVTEILAPITAAPNPPNRNDTDVISIFSDAYTDVTLDELPTSWSSSGFEATTVASDNIWKLTNLDFVGMVTNYTNGIDVSSMEKLHIDYWVPDGTTNELLLKIVNTIDGGEDIESLGTTVAGSWQSIDIDMTGFDGGNLANKEKITQILIDSDGTTGVVYIDNFYFYKAPSGVSTSTIQDFEGSPPAFTHFGNIAAVEVIANPDMSGVNTTQNVAKLTKTAGSEVWAGAFFETTSLDLANYSKISVKTWSPKVGAQV